jgi:hypothetical protein
MKLDFATTQEGLMSIKLTDEDITTSVTKGTVIDSLADPDGTDGDTDGTDGADADGEDSGAGGTDGDTVSDGAGSGDAD